MSSQRRAQTSTTSPGRIAWPSRTSSPGWRQEDEQEAASRRPRQPTTYRANCPGINRSALRSRSRRSRPTGDGSRRPSPSSACRRRRRSAAPPSVAGIRGGEHRRRLALYISLMIVAPRTCVTSRRIGGVEIPQRPSAISLIERPSGADGDCSYAWPSVVAGRNLEPRLRGVNTTVPRPRPPPRRPTRIRCSARRRSRGRRALRSRFSRDHRRVAGLPAAGVEQFGLGLGDSPPAAKATGAVADIA